MKTVILILCILLSAIASAAPVVRPKIVLMTSLAETQEMKRVQNQELENLLQRHFEREFSSSDYQVKVFHLVSPITLWSVLHDPSVVGIFWVSHAKKSTVISSNVISPASVLDAEQNDVKEFFKHTTSSLKFLSLIGCEAKGILDEYSKQQRYRDHLVLHGFKEKVRALPGLKSALRVSRKVLDDPRENHLHVGDSSSREEILFETMSSIKGRLLKVNLGDEVLDVFEAQSDTFSIQIDNDFINQISSKNIIITALDKKDLPSFNISFQGDALWKRFEKGGKPIVGHRNLYINIRGMNEN